MVEVDLGFCPRCGGQLEYCDPPQANASRCPVCGFVVFLNPMPVVVATIVDGDSALLVRRAHAPSHGCWSMPGGYMEMDEAPEAGAARELAEETGLVADPSALRFVGTDYEPLDSSRAVVDLVFAVPRAETRGEPVAGDDAEAVRFWTRREIAADPPELRAGDVAVVLRAIDELGGEAVGNVTSLH